MHWRSIGGAKYCRLKDQDAKGGCKCSCFTERQNPAFIERGVREYAGSYDRIIASLKEHRRDDGACVESFATLERETGLSGRLVRRAVAEMTAPGGPLELVKNGTAKNPSIYRIKEGR
jgi:hypothetical protein